MLENRLYCATARLLVASLGMLPLAGCGSSSSGNSSLSSAPAQQVIQGMQGQAASLRLSTSSGQPGEQIAINPDPAGRPFVFDPGQKTSVIFSNQNGFRAEMDALSVSAAAISVFVPLQLSERIGLDDQVVVTVRVVQAGNVVPATSPDFTILPLVPGSGALGENTADAISQLLDGLASEKSSWEALERESASRFDATRVKQNLSDTITAYAALQAELQKLASGQVDQLELGSFRGQTLTFTADGLRLCDRILGALAVLPPTVSVRRDESAKGALFVFKHLIGLALGAALFTIPGAEIVGAGLMGAALGSLAREYITSTVLLNILGTEAEAGVDDLEKLANTPPFDFSTFKADFQPGSSAAGQAVADLVNSQSEAMPDAQEIQSLRDSLPVIAAPQLQDDHYTSQTSTVDISAPGVLANDSTKLGQITGFESLSSAGGTVALNTSTGAFLYTAPANFSGQDRFRYTVANRYGSKEAAVLLDIVQTPEPDRLSLSPTNVVTDCSVFDLGATNDPNDSVAFDLKFIQFSVANSQGPVRWLTSAGQIDTNGKLLVGTYKGLLSVVAVDDAGSVATSVNVTSGMLKVSEQAGSDFIQLPALNKQFSGGPLIPVGLQTGNGVRSYFRTSAPLLPAGQAYTLSLSNPTPIVNPTFPSFSSIFASVDAANLNLGTVHVGWIPSGGEISLPLPWQATGFGLRLAVPSLPFPDSSTPP